MLETMQSNREDLRMEIDLPATRPVAPGEFERLGEIDIGARIHALRTGNGWTLQQAAEKTGVSLSTLSKIERQDLSPTVTTLSKIAAGFGLRLSQLLETPRVQAVSARRSISRAGDGLRNPTSACDNFLLCADLANRKMTPIRTRVRARSLSDYAEWASYEADIFLVVMRGTLVIYSEHYAPVRLNTSDSIYYDATSGHLWVSEGEEDAEVIWVYAE